MLLGLSIIIVVRVGSSKSSGILNIWVIRHQCSDIFGEFEHHNLLDCLQFVSVMEHPSFCRMLLYKFNEGIT